MNHLSQHDLLAFLRGELSDIDSGQTFGHLAYCETCSGRADALEVLLRDPDGAMEALEARWRESQLGSDPGASSARSFDWVARAWLDPIRKLAAVGMRAVDGLCDSPSLTATMSAPIAGIGDPFLDTVMKDQENASGALDEGREEDLLAALEHANSQIPGVANLAETVLLQDGDEVGRIVVLADRRSVVVLLLDRFVQSVPQASSQVATGPRAAILAHGSQTLQVARLAPEEGSNYWTAEFVVVPTEPFLVALKL